MASVVEGTLEDVSLECLKCDFSVFVCAYRLKQQVWAGFFGLCCGVGV